MEAAEIISLLTPSPLAAAAVSAALLHILVPLLYTLYLRRRWLHAPWGLVLSGTYTPHVAVIIPTYNEERHIAGRLDNIYGQRYPRDRIHVVVVDSASSDNTRVIVEEWIRSHPDLDARLVAEDERRGKHEAVKRALTHIPGEAEIIVLTDADAAWEPGALRAAVKYFSDPSVGAVTGSIYYMGGGRGAEHVYRRLYNEVRVAESKWCSTPIHNGPLLAIRRRLVEEYGLPDYPGSDDTAYGSYIAFTGHRAIQVDDALVYEPLEQKQFLRKARRAATLVLALIMAYRLARRNGVYKRTCFLEIWMIQLYLSTVNPYLLAAAALLLIPLAAENPPTALLLASAGAAALLSEKARAWLYSQAALVAGHLYLVRGKPVKW